MKEGKQQKKHQIKVKVSSGEEKVFATHNHMADDGTFSHTELSDILAQANEFVQSRAMDNDPLVSLDQTDHPATHNEQVVVTTESLKGKALDWAVAEFLGWKEPFYSKGNIDLYDGVLYYQYPDPDETEELVFDHTAVWNPSQNMILAAQLMKLHRVGVWPKTYVGKPSVVVGCYTSPDQGVVREVEAETYELAICKALVRGANGKVTSIPAELLQYLS